ncbi:MAG: LTA synthase family protein [Butyricicoccus sp.]|jgi:phosphoglycerol transferase MdoB-like AlkP superfamily enzyme
MNKHHWSLQSVLRTYCGQIFFYITPLAMFLLVEFLEYGDESKCMLPTSLSFWVNLMAYYGIYILVRAITRRTRLTIWLLNIIFLICGIVTYYSIAIRNAPISPWDLIAAGTAMSVLSGFDLTPPSQVIISIAGVILWGILAGQLQRRGKFPKPMLRERLEAVAASLVLIISFSLIAIFGQGNFYVSTWRQVTANRQNGMLLNFVMNIGTMFNPKPSGYSATTAEDILANREDVYAVEEPNEQNPNIIAIMDETFADLSYLGDLHLENVDDVMPFVRSLSEKKNTITGHLVVPAWGGGTCNSEYEFLTSNTYAFFQNGSYPMLQYVHSETESMASVLSAQGYQTVGIHPYYGSGWGRSRAYPLFGFDQFLDVEDFKDPEILRRYISDKSSFEKVIETYENKPEGTPLFCFNVTMQNHCSYDTVYDNFPEPVEFQYDTIYPLTKQYLSLIQRSDESIKELIKYFKKQDEPTIIVLFGDHQPYIENAFYNYLTSGSGKSSAEITMDEHTVPFFIWANYDIDERDMGRISANYLGPLTLDTANVEMSDYQEYVYSLMDKYPVISCVGCVDKDGIQVPLEMADLSDYKIAQYRNVFDKPKQATAAGSAAGSASGSK